MGIVQRLRQRRSDRAAAASRSGAGAGARPTVDDGRLRFEYAPERDGDPDPGEVVWAWVAYEDDPSQGKDRPVVVVGRFGAVTLAAVALTSKGRPGDADRVAVGTGGWDHERRPSFAKVDRLLRIDPSTVRREGAALERDRFDGVIAAVVDRHRR